MAISINTVYQRVLAIANKEQNGYLTPQEFNVFANLAQTEIFEQYFYDTNQYGRVSGNSKEYSDMLNILDEKIIPFTKNQTSSITSSSEPAYAATFGSTLVTNGAFDSGITNWTAGTAGDEDGGSQLYDSDTQSIKLKNDAANNVFKSKQTITTVVGTLYRVKADINAGSLNTTATNANATAHVQAANVSSNKVVSGTSQSIEFYFTAISTSTSLELIITCTGNTGATDFALFDNVKLQEVSGRKLRIFPGGSYPGSLNSAKIYMLGTVMYADSNGNFKKLDKILPNDFIHINSSPLTKPTLSNPVYVADESHTVRGVDLNRYEISVYPSSISSGEIAVNYIAAPTRCYWAYNVVNEKPLYDASKSVNFELHQSETNTLVNKILQLAGISMQKDNIEKSAIARENKEIQQQKS